MQPPHEVPFDNEKASAISKNLAAVVPEFLTGRLKLRAPALTDFPAYAEIALSENGRFLLEDPTRENAWFDFTNMVACWMLRGHGLWTIEERTGGSIAGFVLIGFEPGDHEPELGYMLLPKAEGRGYATEAAERVKRFAFEDLGFRTLVSTIDPENTASIGVAEKLGGVRDHEAEAAHQHKVVVYRYDANVE